MKIFKNIEGLTFFQLENEEEIDKFCTYFYNNDDFVHKNRKDVADYKRYITLSHKYGENKWCGPLVVDSLKCETLLNDFSKQVNVTYSDKIYDKKVFDDEENKIDCIINSTTIIQGNKKEIEEQLNDISASGFKIKLDSIVIKRYKSVELEILEKKLKRFIGNEEFEKCEEIKNEITWWKKNVMKDNYSTTYCSP